MGHIGGMNWLYFPATRHNKFLSSVVAYQRPKVRMARTSASGGDLMKGSLRLWELPGHFESAVALQLLQEFLPGISRDTTENPTGHVTNWLVKRFKRTVDRKTGSESWVQTKECYYTPFNIDYKPEWLPENEAQAVVSNRVSCHSVFFLT